MKVKCIKCGQEVDREIDRGNAVCFPCKMKRKRKAYYTNKKLTKSKI